MAKLLFLYVKNIGRKIVDQSINFCDDYLVSFEDSQLNIIDLENNENGKESYFWGSNVHDCSLIVGKNGVGKTSILDLLGFNEKTKKAYFPRGKYFMIYKLKNHNEFYFSGTMSNEIKNFNGVDKIINNFSFRKNRDYYYETSLNVKSESIHTYYIRSEAKLSWTKATKIYKGESNKRLKYFYPKIKFEDVLMLVSNFNFIENLNRTIVIEQKITYLNNPRYLAFLYQGQRNEIDENSNNFLFLEKNSYEKNIDLSKTYNRSNQDKILGTNEYKKEYFLLRLLEKIVVNHISKIWNYEKVDNYEKYLILEKILTIRDQSDYFMLNTDYSYMNSSDYYELNYVLRIIREKINYLLKLLKYFNQQKNKISHLKPNVEELYKLFEGISSEFFVDKNFLRIPSEKLEYYNEIVYLQNDQLKLFKFTFENFSEGELVFLDLFAKIANVISHSKKEDCILILDEPDINLHPEWSRQLLNNLIEFIDKNKIEGKVQIIISTHSPFIVTDFPKKNIFTFIRNEKGNFIIKNPEFGFAANIYDLISNTFFMESPVGEFATKKIKEARKEFGTTKSNEIIEKIDDIFLKKLIMEGLKRNDENES